jgi:hypothetical protein
VLSRYNCFSTTRWSSAYGKGQDYTLGFVNCDMTSYSVNMAALAALTMVNADRKIECRNLHLSKQIGQWQMNDDSKKGHSPYIPQARSLSLALTTH